MGYDVLAKEATLKHARAFPGDSFVYPELDPGGLYQWRTRGERHTFNPDTVSLLQIALKRGSYDDYKTFSKAVDGDAETACTLRGLFKFKTERAALPLAEVEPASEIVKRFCTGAMSYGSISLEAHETLAIAMNRLGGKSNTGEGGEDPDRFTPDAEWRPAPKRDQAGRLGALRRDELVSGQRRRAADQDGARREARRGRRAARPQGGRDDREGPALDAGRGPDLAATASRHLLDRGSRAAHLRPQEREPASARLGEAGLRGPASARSRRASRRASADGVLISGHDGGTGASPLASIKYAGMPWEIGLAETQQTLVMNDLRGRIRVQTDGGLKTGRDVAIAALLGADEFGFATAPLVALGCILMRVCHLNTCPVGVATQDPVLRKRFAGTPESVVQYLMFIAEETREYMAKLGFRTIAEMIGHAECLDSDRALTHWKMKGLDFSDLFHRPPVEHAISNVTRQNLIDDLEEVADVELLRLAAPALERGEKVVIEREIFNTDRTLGTILGSEVSRRYGEAGLPEDTITLKLTGSAGQSLAAFCTSGLTFEVEGETNDYAGKGLCGAKIIVKVPRSATFEPSENIITGNVVLYGATSGEAYFQGVAGERFCVRNSGATAVVEGVGDHGCEYMTGGVAVVLGRTGRNFAAGMSGGIAYVLDEDGSFASRVSLETVDLDPMSDEDFESVRRLVRRHRDYTRSRKADDVLRKWDAMAPKLVKVLPKDYKRALSDRIASGSGNG